jgi:hypothetical protein
MKTGAEINFKEQFITNSADSISQNRRKSKGFEDFRVFLLHVGVDKIGELLSAPAFREKRIEDMYFNIYRRSSEYLPAMRQECHVAVPAQCRFSGLLKVSDQYRVDFVIV